MLRLHQSLKSRCENGFVQYAQASLDKQHGREQSIEFHCVLIMKLGEVCISKRHQCLCKYDVSCYVSQADASSSRRTGGYFLE